MYVKNNDEHNCISPVACLMYKGGDSMEIKTEADSDITECSHDDKPNTGMFAVSDNIFSAVSCLYILFVFTFDEHVGYSLFIVYFFLHLRVK